MKSGLSDFDGMYRGDWLSAKPGFEEAAKACLIRSDLQKVQDGLMIERGVRLESQTRLRR